MAIRNQSWYNLNSSRDYPVDETASSLSDKSERVPSDIITDIRVRWPDALGDYAFLGSVAVTPGAVTATVLAAVDLANTPDSYTPIAVITVPLSELTVGKQYALEAMYPGAFGYIVFGSGGTAAPWSGSFSSPNQSLLTPKSARPYATLPVTSMSRLYDDAPLTGIVRLAADSPLEIVSGTREIGGIDRDAIIIRLEADTAESLAGTTPFEDFAGRCGKRPDSSNCGDPVPIETINSVGPNCSGVICLEFKGCAVVGKNTDDCAIVVDCGLGLSDTCAAPYLPDSDGVLPSERTEIMPPAPPDPPPPYVPTDSFSGPVTSITLPYCEPFDSGYAANFSVVSGTWDFAEFNSPEDLCAVSASLSLSCSIGDSGWFMCGYSYTTEQGVSGGTAGISLFTPDAQTTYRKYQTDLQMLAGPTGAKRNGGILVNYKITSADLPLGSPGAVTFYLLEVDYDDAEFRLVYFNGYAYTTLTTVDFPSVAIGDWYNLEFEVLPSATLTTVALSGKLTGPIGQTSQVTYSLSHEVSSNSYLLDSALSGLHTNRAYTRFSYWRVSET